MRTIEHSLLYNWYIFLLSKTGQEKRKRERKEKDEEEVQEKVKKCKVILYHWIFQSILFRWIIKDQKQKLNFMESSFVLSVISFVFSIFMNIKQWYAHAGKKSYFFEEIKKTVRLAEENVFFVISLIVFTIISVNIYKNVASRFFGLWFYIEVILFLLAGYFLFFLGKVFFQRKM